MPEVFTATPMSNGGQNGIQFTWASDNVGWRLVMDTNGLVAPIWLTVPNSINTNQLWLPFDPTQTSVFFEMVYP